MTSYPHLRPDVVDAMSLPRSERIRFAQDVHWIPYPAANRILSKLSELVAYQPQPSMPSILLTGLSGNGKTTLVERFLCEHPRSLTDDGVPHAPVVGVQMPATPNESRFWSEVLHSMNIRHRPSHSASDKEHQALRMFAEHQTRVLLIDEIHNLLNAGPTSQRQFLAVLKRLSNEQNISLVAVGTDDATRALKVDPQVARRFAYERLPDWDLNGEYRRLLATFEQWLPLANPSQLDSRQVALAIWRNTDNTIGSIARLLSKAAERAIQSGQEYIDTEIIEDCEMKTLADMR